MDTLYSIFPFHCKWPPAIDDVLTADPDAISLRLVSGAKNLEILPSFKNLKALWCFDINEVKLDLISSCTSLQSLYIENLKTQNLGCLRKLSSIDLLGIETCSSATSLDGLVELKSLSGLAITHFKHVHDLGPLAELNSLRALAVGGGMWTRMKVDSFEPLEGLSNLELLSLTNIKALDESLRPLAGLKKLKNLDIANFYPMREFAWLSQKLKTAECTWFQPYIEFPHGACKKCSRSTLVMLAGNRKPSLCRICDIRKLEKHTHDWTELAQKAN